MSFTSPLTCRGLNLLEEWVAADLIRNFEHALGSLFISITEVDDAHSFSDDENKYSWTYHTPS